MDDAHNDVNVNASRRERAREPNGSRVLLTYSFVLGTPSGEEVLEDPLWLYTGNKS